MASDARSIGKRDLVVGQWIQFFTKDLSGASITEQNQRFLVISREDATFDPCRCFLSDISGAMHDYCPRMDSLGFRDLGKSEIRVVSRASVESIHGIEKVRSVYERYKDMKVDNYYPVQVLGQSKVSPAVKDLIKFNEILAEKASQPGSDMETILRLSMAALDTLEKKDQKD